MINKKVQDSKIGKFSLLPRKKFGQEEIVGFVVIVVIVSVILLILLWFLLNNKNQSGTGSYEIENFIQATLQYTTDCESYTDFLSVQNLIVSCDNKDKCLDERDTCIVLNQTLENIMDKSWNVGEQSAIKGYKLDITSAEQEKLMLEKGNETTNSKGGFQDFSVNGNDYKVALNIYS